MAEKLKIAILTDKSSWMNKYNEFLLNELNSLGHEVKIIYSKNEIVQGDVLFLLSCFELIGKQYLDLNKNNIVVHASKLPQGKGWSPSSWQILEGKNAIPLTMFEAVEAVDAGDIYLTDEILLDGTELIDEWQDKLGKKIIDMIIKYIKCYPLTPTPQQGEESFYKKRTQVDSELDINKTIKNQFNLLRIVDNEDYPAFFTYKNKKYILKIISEDIK